MVSDSHTGWDCRVQNPLNGFIEIVFICCALFVQQRWRTCAYALDPLEKACHGERMERNDAVRKRVRIVISRNLFYVRIGAMCQTTSVGATTSDHFQHDDVVQ